MSNILEIPQSIFEFLLIILDRIEGELEKQYVLEAIPTTIHLTTSDYINNVIGLQFQILY